MIDLHVHSTFSDGAETPSQLVDRAVCLGLRALALTDHDNVAGAPAFLDACRARGLDGLVGVEISAAVSGGALHMLGLGVDPADAGLRAILSQVLDGRDWRNRRILEGLSALGLELTWDEVAALAGGDVVGRLHFAQAMVRRGYAANKREVFDRYLAKGRPAYVDRFRVPPEEAVRLIAAAGGVAVLAHPFTWEPDFGALETKTAALRDAGLRGIEAYYSDHTPEQTVFCLRLAGRLGLAVAGGSDYHGGHKDAIAMGTGFGNLEVPDSLLPPLKALIHSRAGMS